MDARKFTTCSPCIIRETVNSNFTPWMVKLYPVFAVRDMFGGNGGHFMRKIEKYSSRIRVLGFSRMEISNAFP